MKNKITFIIILAVVIAVLVFFAKKDSDLPQKEVDLVEDIEIITDLGEEVEVEVITEEEVVDIPDLNRKIEFPENFPLEAQESIIKKINEVKVDLEEDPTSFNDWLQLGIYRKMIEDYEGTELVWEYAGYLEPEKFVVWGNLGDLNSLYIRDNLKAEKYYLEALKYGPSQDYLYFKIADFYSEFLENKEKAILIVEKGLENNPSSKSLKTLLNSLK